MKAEITALVKYERKDPVNTIESYYLEMSLNKRIMRISINYMDFVALKESHSGKWKEGTTDSPTGNITTFTPISRARK